MADAYDLYLPSDFPEDLHALLVRESLEVVTKAKKLANGVMGNDHFICSNGSSISILEASATEQCQMRYLLCLARPNARGLLHKVTSLLESFGARSTPE